jgi:hypothetical protein
MPRVNSGKVMAAGVVAELSRRVGSRTIMVVEEDARWLPALVFSHHSHVLDREETTTGVSEELIKESRVPF